MWWRDLCGAHFGARLKTCLRAQTSATWVDPRKPSLRRETDADVTIRNLDLSTSDNRLPTQKGTVRFPHARFWLVIGAFPVTRLLGSWISPYPHFTVSNLLRVTHSKGRIRGHLCTTTLNVAQHDTARLLQKFESCLLYTSRCV